MGSTRSGATTSTTPCTPRSPASGRATTPTSARWRLSRKPLNTSFFITASGLLSGTVPTAARSTWHARPGTGSSATSRTTTRSAIELSVTGCAPSPPGSPRPWCSPRRSRRCCSWARSGARTPRGSTLPTTPIPGSPAPSATGAGRSSPPTAGLPATCQTPRTGRRSCVPSWTGPSRTASRTRACWPGTANCSRSAARIPSWPTPRSPTSTSTTTRPPAGSSSTAARSA